MNLTLPSVFLFSDRVYAYSMTRFQDLDGRRLELEGLILEHGLCLSGNFIFRANPARSCAHLAAIGPGSAVSWVALTFEEARAVALHLTANDLEALAS